MHQCTDNHTASSPHQHCNNRDADNTTIRRGYRQLLTRVRTVRNKSSTLGFNNLEMLSWKIFLCTIIVAVWHEAQSASLPLLPPVRIGYDYEVVEEGVDPRLPSELKVGEGVPPPLCVGHCASPPAGPVCALNAAGTARTFATLCELEAVSCRESTFYAITSLGEC